MFVKFAMLVLLKLTNIKLKFKQHEEVSRAQRSKCLPAMWETWVRSLGQEDPLEKGMVTHSSILVWRIPWAEKPGELQSLGSQRDRQD